VGEKGKVIEIGKTGEIGKLWGKGNVRKIQKFEK